MSSRLARLVIAVITICALLGAGLVQNLPSAKADGMRMAMMTDQGGGNDAATPCHDTSAPPCNDQVPGCVVDLGCIFTVALPALPMRMAERLVWDRISYWSASGLPEGITPEPFIGPPIHFV
ncbi:hypothetical protein [Roseomonas chloroacetimidivorans]|uniref:hypothetical protein n=1 Tax=Roseomonas chloroacetimidivorans TaxID=1766656 RepID=UPI003C741494